MFQAVHQNRYWQNRPTRKAQPKVRKLSDEGQGIKAWLQEHATRAAKLGRSYAETRLESLMDNLERYGSLTEKQMDFARSMIAGLDEPQERAKVDLGSFSKMVSIFQRAGGVRAPKVTLRVGQDDVNLTVAGEGARVPGSINVATGSFNNGTWYGRILTDGRFEVSPRAQTPQPVMEMLQRFADDPIGTMQSDGKLTGRCSICRRKLTDAVSVAQGIGPVCRSRFMGEAC